MEGPGESVAQIRKKIEDVERARSLLGDETADSLIAKLEDELAQVEAEGRSVAIGRDARGSVIVTGDHNKVLTDSTDPQELLELYVGWLGNECSRLPLGVIDDQFTARQGRVSLGAVYVPLDVASAPPPEGGERGTAREWAGLMARGGGERAPALEALAGARGRRLVLLGEAGSGKTTFGHDLCRRLARGVKKDEADLGLPETLRGLVPLRFVLSEAAARHLGGGGPRAFWSAFGESLEECFGEETAGRALPSLETLLRTRGVFAVFDGLDEVPEGSRRALLDAVESFSDLLDAGRSRFLVTARPYAYADPKWRLEGFETAALAPFSSGQVAGFVERWYGAVRGAFGWKEADASARAEVLQSALAERAYLADLAARPLLLTLMATLHSSRGQLPEDRAELYDGAVGLLLDRWQRHREVTGKDGELKREPSLSQVLAVGASQLRGALERLALAVHERQRGEEAEREAPAAISEGELLAAFRPLLGPVTPDALIGYLRDRAGLLIERDKGEHAFPHRSFQEYLAASHLLDLEDPWRELEGRVLADAGWWREVALLAVGKLKGSGMGTAVGVLNHLLPEPPAGRKKPNEAVLRVAVLVALACTELGLVGKAAPKDFERAIVERARRWLLKIVRRSWLPPKERLEAGDLLGRLGDPRRGVGVLRPKGSEPLPAIEWLEIPAGTFLMGSSADDELARDNEKPQHEVHLKRFWIGRYPITNAQYRLFVESGELERRELWTDAGWEWLQGAEVDISVYPEQFREEAGEWYAGRPKERRLRPFYWDHPRLGAPNRPVVGITFFEALAFSRWLDERLRQADRGVWRQLKLEPLPGYRVALPSEAQWERVARGTDGRRWPWGERFRTGDCNSEEVGLGEPSPVGLFDHRKSPNGAADMTSNVWEWTTTIWSRCSFETADYKYPYSTRDSRDETERQALRILRGGSFYVDKRAARCAARNGYIPENFIVYNGFRVVFSLASSEY